MGEAERQVTRPVGGRKRTYPKTRRLNDGTVRILECEVQPRAVVKTSLVSSVALSLEHKRPEELVPIIWVNPHTAESRRQSNSKAGKRSEMSLERSKKVRQRLNVLKLFREQRTRMSLSARMRESFQLGLKVLMVLPRETRNSGITSVGDLMA